MTPADTLVDLRKIFPDKTYLSPQDLARVLGISDKQQHNLRKAGDLDIPMKQIGRRLYITIYDLAEYLANGFVGAEEPKRKRGRPRITTQLMFAEMQKQFWEEFYALDAENQKNTLWNGRKGSLIKGGGL